MKVKFSKSIRKQLKALSRITRRTPAELVQCLVEPLLSQIVDENDTELMQAVILEQ